MSKTPNSINLDTEIKQCAVTQPYEGLQSDFGKKLINHLSSHSKFKEEHIKKIADKLNDKTQTLTPEEWKDFLEFMQEHEDFFNTVIRKHKGQFPAWIQVVSDSDTLDMEQESHILYNDWEYISLDKIQSYVRSRIKGGWKTDEWEKYEVGSSKALWRKIEQTSAYHYNALHGDELWSLRKINYNERINQNGITIHNINGIEFSSMDTGKDPSDRRFTEQDLNNDPDDESKGRSLENLKKNPEYVDFLKKSDTKAFESIEKSNAFHFELMQAVADKLFLQKVHIDMDFIDNPKNSFEIKIIIAWLHTLTGRFLSIPYKITEDGLLSTIDCDDNFIGINRDSDTNDGDISFFHKVYPIPSK